ncbi:MAG: glycosyltransferase family 2 protein, partial [Clostridiales bacterium]|nr:glycosyltransferase family 2 protein [Clostridiales bacterium]
MRKPPFFHTVSSTAFLRPDPDVPARIRKAAAALRALPREALTPSEAWIEDNAAPLLREASARIREARQLPPLPAMSGVPRALLLARKICAADDEEIDEGLVLLRRFFPARPLPRLQVEHLTDERRTLAVVPTLLTSPRQALRAAHHLAVLHCADPEMDCLLLSDFADSLRETEPEDEGVLSALRESISALNERFGGGFLCLHRARQWDAQQQRFTGRERKRGALESLNRLLVGREQEDRFLYASCPPDTLKNRYAYVITLDADTFLPPGAARQLAGAMEHPLQKGRVAVIQPRMEAAPDRVKTRTQKWLGGRGGTDPYHLAVQDVYQDVMDAGSFVGKGIYAPRLWLERLEGRLPPGRLLSHDLIEGEIAGCALAEDIALFDGHPARLAGWQKRLERWTRGDWQLLPFLRDRRLSLLSRHKIWDNLRFSLVPASRLALLSLVAARLPLLIPLALPWPASG